MNLALRFDDLNAYSDALSLPAGRCVPARDFPKVYTRPWTVEVIHKRCPAGVEVMEYAGVEGDQAVAEAADVRRLKGLAK